RAANTASDQNMDAASRADARLRLEFREVWWAESFGLPKVGPALRWAQIQFREQMKFLLLPIGIRLGPAQTARRAPAREIPQALTYRPKVTDHTLSSEPRQPVLGLGLWAYDLVQYAWKLAQWIILMPLILLLLLSLSIVRLLARLPLLSIGLL